MAPSAWSVPTVGSVLRAADQLKQRVCRLHRLSAELPRTVMSVRGPPRVEPRAAHLGSRRGVELFQGTLITPSFDRGAVRAPVGQSCREPRLSQQPRTMSPASCWP